MLPNPHDLFGEIAITWPEIYTWVDVNVPRWANSSRLDWYIKNYNVVGKAQRDKAFELTGHPYRLPTMR